RVPVIITSPFTATTNRDKPAYRAPPPARPRSDGRGGTPAQELPRSRSRHPTHSSTPAPPGTNLVRPRPRLPAMLSQPLAPRTVLAAPLVVTDQHVRS